MSDIRDKHEEATCREFLSIYNKENNTDLNFIRKGNPEENEPDCICNNNLVIELVGVYDNLYQAEKMWNDARGKDIKRQSDSPLFTLDNLQNEIGKKLQKMESGNYDGFTGKIILVCNLHSQLLQDQEVEEYIKSYTSFRSDGHFNKYFDEVWVSWKSDRNGDWKIKKLE